MDKRPEIIKALYAPQHERSIYLSEFRLSCLAGNGLFRLGACQTSLGVGTLAPGVDVVAAFIP